MASIYEPSDNEIEQMMKQIEITKPLAISLLRKYNGNIVDAILEAFDINVNPNQYTIIDEKTETEKMLENYRHILDQKDIVYQTTVSSDIDITGTQHYEYVAFDGSTTEFKSTKITTYSNTFLNDIVKDYLNDMNGENLLSELLENSNTQELSIVQRYLGNDAKKSLMTKWGFQQCAILYFEGQIKNGASKLYGYNKLATTLLKKAKHINTTDADTTTDHDEGLIGACMIVNKWF